MTLHNFIQVELLESGEGGDDFVYFWGKKTPRVMGANAGIVGDDAVSSQTSKTEVLQTPSATHVNRGHGV